ncbi:hypothetical protein LNQ82_03005 [Conchiformibius steedae DSM 2580]|uniref:Sel1 repeat family protein n=1 Tax=Conchiformibius steedae DSM 2580 TaxID=1121352 RepID=A0AAE9HYB4_9NEIS|nr:hypothetical protein [Conchiformibius steedae]QMT33492.1 hypothetical protein H3L98_10530 [Conchiformibius steedae]URD68150.1 hypothetical protein LNQ82_03005 [Conchiformibius steedae DSM 2580]
MKKSPPRRLVVSLIAALMLTAPVYAKSDVQVSSDGTQIRFTWTLNEPTSSANAKAYAAFKKGNYAEAKRLWAVQAAQGNANAQYSFGVLYLKGLGVTNMG